MPGSILAKGWVDDPDGTNARESLAPAGKLSAKPSWSIGAGRDLAIGLCGRSQQRSPKLRLSRVISECTGMT